MAFKALLALLPLMWISALMAWETAPWGCDADIARGITATPDTPTLGDGGIGALIAFHQSVITNADGPRSHFVPSSSEYTRQAIRKYGPLVGTSMGMDRLMRENSDAWHYYLTPDPHGFLLKWDPVP